MCALRASSLTPLIESERQKQTKKKIVLSGNYLLVGGGGGGVSSGLFRIRRWLRPNCYVPLVGRARGVVVVAVVRLCCCANGKLRGLPSGTRGGLLRSE